MMKITLNAFTNDQHVFVVGDIHGDYEYLSSLSKQYAHNCSAIIQVGDFGYFPNFSEIHKRLVSTKFYVPVYFIDGNHENHWALRAEALQPITEVHNNLFYCSRGSGIELSDGRKILFIGGGLSLDKHLRKQGVDYFPEETISTEDYNHICEVWNGVDADIIISHTCPVKVKKRILGTDKLFYDDPSEIALQNLWELKKPGQWFFGHFHTFFRETIDGTEFVGLDINQFKEIL